MSEGGSSSRTGHTASIPAPNISRCHVVAARQHARTDTCEVDLDVRCPDVCKRHAIAGDARITHRPQCHEPASVVSNANERFALNSFRIRHSATRPAAMGGICSSRAMASGSTTIMPPLRNIVEYVLFPDPFGPAMTARSGLAMSRSHATMRWPERRDEGASEFPDWRRSALPPTTYETASLPAQGATVDSPADVACRGSFSPRGRQCLRRRVVRVVAVGLEERVLRAEAQLHGADLAVAVFGEDELGRVGLG